MPYEDIEIRITKNGEIFVRIAGADEMRLRDYRVFLEEMIGPIRSESVVRTPPWEKPIGLAAENTQHEQEQERG